MLEAVCVRGLGVFSRQRQNVQRPCVERLSPGTQRSKCEGTGKVLGEEAGRAGPVHLFAYINPTCLAQSVHLTFSCFALTYFHLTFSDSD